MGPSKELGSERLMERVRIVQKEAVEAGTAAQAGDFSPAKAFVWKHKSLAAAVLLPLGVILRFPGLIGMALRMLGLVAAATLQNPAMREMFARWTWLQWDTETPNLGLIKPFVHMFAHVCTCLFAHLCTLHDTC